MNEIKEVIQLLTPIIVALGVAYINYKTKKRDNEQNEKIKKRDEEQLKQLDIRNKIVIERINELELVVNNVEKKINIHIMDDDLRQAYRKAVKNTIIVVLEASHTLKQDTKAC